MGCGSASATTISIHAPQWGATGGLPFGDLTPTQFQSTHPSGVRRRWRRGMPGCMGYFNPRTPVGCDRQKSYHTSPTLAYFNPRTPVGCDFVPFKQVHSIVISIHAPQWGATRANPRRFSTYDFNPRTPVGCDGLDAMYYHLLAISIHAPQWGATTGRLRPIRLPCISIHAPQWGATARMGIAFHNTEAPSVLKTDFIAKIHVHRSIHKFSNQKHQQTIHF